MDDLISRSALLAAYDKAHQGPPGGARKLIENAPDAIVRCGDCRYGMHIKNRAGDACVQCNNDELQMFGDVHFPDWFCADGKRKD